MDAKKQEILKSFIKTEVDDAINKVFEKVHMVAGTKHGDITPEQALKLENLQEEIEELIFTQTIQNL